MSGSGNCMSISNSVNSSSLISAIAWLDYVLGTFANPAIADMSDDELTEFEMLMQLPDPDMYKWLSGSVPVPGNFDNALVRKIRQFHLGSS